MGNNKSRKKYVSESPTNEQSRHDDDENCCCCYPKKHHTKNELKRINLDLQNRITQFESAADQLRHANQDLQRKIQELNSNMQKGIGMLDEAKKTTREKEQTIKVLEDKISKLQTKIDGEWKRNKQLHNDLQSKAEDQTKLEQKIEDLKKCNSELLSRLSAIAGAKLIDGNPNIADLSDENRAIKLSEQFSELYDNDWTDAFSYLCMVYKGNDSLDKGVSLMNGKQSKHSENEICKILFAILTAIYKDRKMAAECEIEQLMASLQNFCGGQDPPLEMVRQLKDKRKKDLRGCSLPEMNQKLTTELQKLLPSTVEINGKHIKEYIEKCFRLCRLMTVQDPPVFMETKSSPPGERFNGSLQKPYTQTGPFVDFVVWPTLYLCKDGNVLSKGVVQCTSQPVKNDEIILDTPNSPEKPIKQQSAQSTSELKSDNRGTNNEVKDEKSQVLSESDGPSAQKIPNQRTKTKDVSMTADIQQNEKSVEKTRAKNELSHSNYENICIATSKHSATPNTSPVERTESLGVSGKRLEKKTTINVKRF